MHYEKCLPPPTFGATSKSFKRVNDDKSESFIPFDINNTDCVNFINNWKNGIAVLLDCTDDGKGNPIIGASIPYSDASFAALVSDGVTKLAWGAEPT
jgi:hypothetical protein